MRSRPSSRSSACKKRRRSLMSWSGSARGPVELGRSRPALDAAVFSKLPPATSPTPRRHSRTRCASTTDCHDPLNRHERCCRSVSCSAGRGKQRAARESLESALRRFDALGAARWADRARTELHRIAGRASDPLALTPTEEQVAKLVADGQTNPEVAAALFISVKTVEANLTRIYRKLGVTSRRELAHHRDA